MVNSIEIVVKSVAGDVPERGTRISINKYYFEKGKSRFFEIERMRTRCRSSLESNVTPQAAFSDKSVRVGLADRENLYGLDRDPVVLV